MSERTAYERFGRRTGLREYVKLSTLLGQNLKRGNSALLERLHEEAENASQEMLLQVRKSGEEAGTKI
ncbi:bacterial type II secretion system protein F domain protein, partial [Klebsiella pneumoniae]